VRSPGPPRLGRADPQRPQPAGAGHLAPRPTQEVDQACRPFEPNEDEVASCTFVTIDDLLKLKETEDFTQGFLRSLDIYLQGDVEGDVVRGDVSSAP
jgi:hypothetical protein